MDWNEIAAAAINSVLVLIAVQFLKTKGIPWLNLHVPWLLPLIAMAIGPLMMIAMSYLSEYFGYLIDLSPIIGVFTGGMAVALHQVGKQFKKVA